jgi:hypothetical protein
MRGSIKFGKRWVPLRAEEILAPLHGFYWPATVAGGLLRGSDAYVDGDALCYGRCSGWCRSFAPAAPAWHAARWAAP